MPIPSERCSGVECGLVRAWEGRTWGRTGTLVATYLTRQVLRVATYQKVSIGTGLSLGTTGLCPTLAPRVLRSASRGEPVGVVGGVEAHTEHRVPRGRTRW